MNENEKTDPPFPKDTYAPVEEAQKRYLKTEKGKSAKKRYDQSEQGKSARKRYLESEKGQEALLRYYLSEKAQSQREQRKALMKLFRQLDNFTQDNPNKSMEEFFESLGGTNEG